MTVRTTTIKLIYKGEIIKQRTLSDKTESFVRKEWSKLYPKHLFDKCEIKVEDGKEYYY